MLSKLTDGVLVVQHGLSRRAFAPTLKQRLLLMWIFRYFDALPSAVLTRWQKQLISEVVATQKAAPLPRRGASAIIGVVETPVVPPTDAHQLPHGTDWEFIG